MDKVKKIKEAFNRLKGPKTIEERIYASVQEVLSNGYINEDIGRETVKEAVREILYKELCSGNLSNYHVETKDGKVTVSFDVYPRTQFKQITIGNINGQ